MSATHQLMSAEFHPYIRWYLFVLGIGGLFISFIGIPLIPLWLLFGFYFCNRYYQSLVCVLTDRTLELKKGHLFRIEKTIPLDKIQDLTFREGPLLRTFGLCILDIETAGQSNPQGSSDAKIIGIKRAKEFRDRVIIQRDLVTQQPNAMTAVKPPVDSDQTRLIELLTDIRNTLQHIDRQLARQ